jgi:ADP-heptose:LPS heptosyltransferase
VNIPFADELLHFYVAQRARARPVPPISEWRLRGTRSVLLVLTTGLGDAVLSTPVFPALRKALPNAEIRLLCRAAWLPLFAADPDLNGVIRYPGKYRRFFSLVAELRRFSPDITIVLHGNDPDILPLAFLSGSRFIVRIPTEGTRYGFLLSNRDRAGDRATVPGWHYIDNRLRILDTIGVAPADRYPRVHLSPAVGESMAARMRARLGGRTYWVMHARAADPYKNWPFEKTRAVLEYSRSAHPAVAVLLTGSKADREALQRLAAGLADVHVVAGEFDIAETAACLAGATCVVAPDTGVLHLAAALGVQVIGLYAPTSASLVGPRSREGRAVIIQKTFACDLACPRQCPYMPHNCMDQISVEEVRAALESALAR